MTDQHSVYPSGHRGVVNNSVTGHVGGTVIQAGDIRGGLDFSGGPGVAPFVQVGGNEQSAGGSSPVEVMLTAQLAEEIEMYLEQMSSADLGQRSSRAENLLQQLRALI
jgi:hypothetical protein